ncbi:uncharacterized protein si:dkeyp-113d7.10 isoform X2 [Thalassophryne amazonica]|uniref:uncharacterized protein si:dkeyp-113d7.10 isoform X2 n=1 Tax=Thalassophryne amazonica TaxID=390379 RepID=UPI001470A97A|nr:uncharacterized protein si:dkeyp-113d7.10 isoform X2 [Thalassophryne amazonica]
MNGAVYISFFQGQLESVLEQVVQLAVQEISKTVGSSLNALLLETAAKEQQNRRLRVQLQQNRRRTGAAPLDGSGAQPGGLVPGVRTDSSRLEQRGRVVDQLKSVLQKVLDFAMCELTKIVEASFDDLLLEITKLEAEQQVLEERLGRSSKQGGGGGQRRGSANDSISPSGSEDTKEELSNAAMCEELRSTDSTNTPAILSISQDWVPVLDKVFSQNWSRDVWQTKDLGVDSGGGRCHGAGGAEASEQNSTPSVTLEPAPSSPQQDPRWTPLEDMEVLSSDDNSAETQMSGGDRAGVNRKQGSAGHALSPEGWGSSASMLHRLLTLPSQLLEDSESPASMEAPPTKETEGTNDHHDDIKAPGQACPLPLTTKEEKDHKDRKKRRRVWLECDECGRRFSRASLLKVHRQTHSCTAAESTAVSSLQSATAASAFQSSVSECSVCGKRFSSAIRLESHIQTQHPGQQSLT